MANNFPSLSELYNLRVSLNMPRVFAADCLGISIARLFDYEFNIRHAPRDVLERYYSLLLDARDGFISLNFERRLS